MKLCTGCPAHNAKPICDKFDPEPSEMSENGGTIFSDYCMTCDHTEECHDELTDAQVAFLQGER